MSTMFILKKAIAIILSMLFCILLSPSLIGCTALEPLVLQITSPEDGAELSVNVQKVSGVASDPEATVQINGIEAEVSQDGAFYAYIDLEEGENTIEAKATWGKYTQIETITVTFSPALAVYLSLEPEEGDVDYRVTPITVTGWVSDAQAIVTVDGNQVQVAEDGSYSTQVQLNVDTNGIEAAATLNWKEDRMSYLIGLSPEGKLFHIPGWIIFYTSMNTMYDHEIQLKAGEIKSVDVNLEVRKSISEPRGFYYNIYRVGGEYRENELPMPEGLEISIEPSRFTIYPNTIYHSILTITTTPELTPGQYFLLLESYLGEHKGMAGWIEVNIAE